MSYYVRVYCRSERSLARAQPVEFVKDGVCFETGPVFQPAEETELALERWETLQIMYAPERRPIILHHNDRDALVEAELAELGDLLAEREISDPAVLARDRDLRRIVAFRDG